MRNVSRQPGQDARDTAMDMEVHIRWRCAKCCAMVVFDAPASQPAACPVCHHPEPAFTATGCPH